MEVNEALARDWGTKNRKGEQPLKLALLSSDLRGLAELHPHWGHLWKNICPRIILFKGQGKRVFISYSLGRWLVEGGSVGEC